MVRELARVVEDRFVENARVADRNHAPVYWRLRTHIAGSAFCTAGGWPISMMVVCVKLSAMTSPRTPPMVMRSPTLKVWPRRMTK